jgi:hydrogenase expression/formation protein HypC
MCLGAPGRIVSIDDFVGVVDCLGDPRTVGLQLLDEPPAVGDYVLVHLGLAVRRIPDDEVEEALAFFRTLAAELPRGTGVAPTQGRPAWVGEVPHDLVQEHSGAGRLR